MLKLLHKHRKRIQEIGTGIFLYESFNFVYDWLFYPFAVAYWGLLVGGSIAATGSIIQNAVMFWLYDYMKVDWLGAHAVRQLDDKENKSRLERLITWIGKKKITLWEKMLNPFVFIMLTIPVDPLIVAIHYRKKHFGGVTARDWLILAAAVVTAIAWWLLKVGIVVEAVKHGAHYLGLWA